MSWRDKIAAVLAGKVGGPTPTGIHVYHSSPHDFDKFDLAKIGTGEGAQVYGHGIYAAENPAVSGQGGQYWKNFYDKRFGDFVPHNETWQRNVEQMAADRLQQHGFDPNATLKSLQEMAAAYKQGPMFDKFTAAIDMIQSGKQIGPRTYEVNFRAKPEELLDWDKPLAQQPAGPAAWNVAKKWLFGSPEKMTGEEAYRGIAAIEDKPRASNVFRDEAGIPGIRYLDEGSRMYDAEAKRMIGQHGSREAALAAALKEQQVSPYADWWRSIVGDLQKPQTYNYVAFDPSKLDIMAKYGVIGATGGVLGAGAMGGTIDQSTYGARP
jgi:hypothetical protein